MQSVNPDINSLHSAYCETLRISCGLLPAYERWWSDALKAQMTPQDVELVLRERQKGIRKGDRHPPCLYLRNICGSDEAIGDVMNEASIIKARMRGSRVSKGKAEVLRSTGRPLEKETDNVRLAGDVLRGILK